MLISTPHALDYSHTAALVISNLRYSAVALTRQYFNGGRNFYLIVEKCLTWQRPSDHFSSTYYLGGMCRRLRGTNIWWLIQSSWCFLKNLVYLVLAKELRRIQVSGMLVKRCDILLPESTMRAWLWRRNTADSHACINCLCCSKE